MNDVNDNPNDNLNSQYPAHFGRHASSPRRGFCRQPPPAKHRRHACDLLELSDERDGRGLPKPRIHFTAGENEKRMTTHADKIMRQIWEAAGGKNLRAFQRFAHTIGTCRMETNPDTSVVNADGTAHDIPNLAILDNSVFPGALSANTASTIMAIALRGADKFLKNRAGD